MKRIALVAVVLLLAILLGCSPRALVTSPSNQEAPTTTPKTSASSSMPSSPKPAEFIISGLTITPKEVTAGSSVGIEVLVTNMGELSGTYDVILKIDDTIEGT